MQMSPVIAIHLSAALGALALGPVVRATAIASVQRDEAGRTSLLLRERTGERVAVSRVYAQRFRAM